MGLLIAGIERVCLGAEVSQQKGGLSEWMWVSWGKIAFVATHVGDPQVQGA